MLKIELIRFEAQDVITTSVAAPTEAPTEAPVETTPPEQTVTQSCACSEYGCVKQYWPNSDHGFGPYWAFVSCDGNEVGDHFCGY